MARSNDVESIPFRRRDAPVDAAYRRNTRNPLAIVASAGSASARDVRDPMRLAEWAKVEEELARFRGVLRDVDGKISAPIAQATMPWPDGGKTRMADAQKKSNGCSAIHKSERSGPYVSLRL